MATIVGHIVGVYGKFIKFSNEVQKQPICDVVLCISQIKFAMGLMQIFGTNKCILQAMAPGYRRKVSSKPNSQLFLIKPRWTLVHYVCNGQPRMGVVL